MRALLGLVIGGVTSIAPTMLIETAPEGLTGFFGNLNQVGCVIGIVIMYLQGNWTVNVTKGFSKWWSLEITCATLNIIGAALIWLCPETSSLSKNDVKKDKPRESICQKKYIGKIFVGIGMMFIQQFSGINAILTNLDDNFREVGVPLDSGVASAISVAAQFIAVFVSGFLVDKLGRRPLFCLSCFGCGATLVIFALNYKYNWANWISIVVIFIYMFFFGAALGPVPWFIIPELFPITVRSIGASIISMANQLFSFTVIFIFPWLKGTTDDQGNITSGIGLTWTSIVFAIITFLGGIFGFFFIIEPKITAEPLDNEDNQEGQNGEETSTQINVQNVPEHEDP
ncbi:major facilitator superfamily protein [Trichomonas vaginalis G3]|uniref:Major facilitator superfamily protein n=1 Tax=Trichomonas vaginalis (strain ATCC PRA-98 / G3) TaxID=412133 RepID=A2F9B7_TRIV3|nr:major facilitator superfamily transporter [Trichomonas vaginalis G3]EAX98489.1 major facilitator superfamily protein [Trichomonas vaginalis G3]KAI5506719.1 glucose import [Trichomonas vaginalis G3]|eukprot:XP_001311419.1 major facilitator superfamily transporter [Trichomonas vaginalis G3]